MNDVFYNEILKYGNMNNIKFMLKMRILNKNIKNIIGIINVFFISSDQSEILITKIDNLLNFDYDDGIIFKYPLKCIYSVYPGSRPITKVQNIYFIKRHPLCRMIYFNNDKNILFSLLDYESIINYFYEFLRKKLLDDYQKTYQKIYYQNIHVNLMYNF